MRSEALLRATDPNVLAERVRTAVDRCDDEEVRETIFTLLGAASALFHRVKALEEQIEDERLEHLSEMEQYDAS